MLAAHAARIVLRRKFVSDIPVAGFAMALAFFFDAPLHFFGMHGDTAIVRLVYCK